jgi:hypothetical protein
LNLPPHGFQTTWDVSLVTKITLAKIRTIEGDKIEGLETSNRWSFLSRMERAEFQGRFFDKPSQEFLTD